VQRFIGQYDTMLLAAAAVGGTCVPGGTSGQRPPEARVYSSMRKVLLSADSSIVTR
jgi:outer membrane murein-binding lipoprotein Lpp